MRVSALRSKRSELPSLVQMLNFLIILTLALIFGGCASSPSTLRVSELGWQGNSVTFALTGKTGLPKSVEVECLNCNVVEGYYTVKPVNGTYSVTIPQTLQLAMTELSIKGNGIDTLVRLLVPEGDAAARLYPLTKPLIGRIRAGAFSNLYYDRDIDSLATGIMPGTELNLYSDSGRVYEVQHPNYPEPLFLPHSLVLRLH